MGKTVRVLSSTFMSAIMYQVRWELCNLLKLLTIG